MGFDGSCVEGFCRTRESDMLAFPDASTFQVLPWRPESNAVGRMFCDIRTPEGKPFEGDPRGSSAIDMGYVLNVGPELGSSTSRTSIPPRLKPGGYFDRRTRLRLRPAPRHGAPGR